MISRALKDRGQIGRTSEVMLNIHGMIFLSLIGFSGISGCEDSYMEKIQKAKPLLEVPTTPQFVSHEILVQYTSASSPEEETFRPKKDFIKKWMDFQRKGEVKAAQKLLENQRRVITELGNQLISGSKEDKIEVLRDLPLLGMQYLKLTSEKTTEALIEQYKEDPSVNLMKNYKVYPLSHEPVQKPNDKLWQEHSVSTDPGYSKLSKLWGLEKIGMKEAWEKAKVWEAPPTEQAVVAVIDSGIDLNHPDLPPSILWENKDEKNGVLGEDDEDWGKYIDDIHGVNFVALARTGPQCQIPQTQENISDEYGHGTGIAGIIAAGGDNQAQYGTEMVGVIGNGQVKVMTLKVYCAGSQMQFWTTLEIILEAIEYAIQMRVQVINASWTLSGGIRADELTGFRRVIQDANNAGVLFVVAAGNQPNDHDSLEFESYPASFHFLDNVIVVAATTEVDALRVDSGRGKTTVHIAAPGSNIYTTDIHDGLQEVSHTSAAAPFVSGCAAFLQAQRKFQNKTFLQPSELKGIIMKSGHFQPGPDSLKEQVVGGSLNCIKAYELAMSG